MRRKGEREKIQKEKEEGMKYEREMREKFMEFVKERCMEERREKSIRNKEESIEMRLSRMKHDAQHRLSLIEDFKLTLDHLEFSQ